MRRSRIAVCLGLSVLIGCVSPGHYCPCNSTEMPPAALVMMTDFSLKDGAVSAMKGVELIA